MPAMMELRIRACHVRGSFVCKDNVAPAISRAAAARRARRRSTTTRLSHPPSTFRHEKLKVERAPAGGAALHRRARPERGLRRRARRPRPHRAGRAVQLAGPRAAAARPGRRVRRRSGCRCWCSTSSARWCPRRSRAFCARQARGAGGRGGPARVHRAGDRDDPAPRATSQTRAPRQGPAAAGRRVHGRGDAPRASRDFFARRRAGAAAARARTTGSRRLDARRAGGRRASSTTPLPRAAAGLLHRLPGAAGVRRAEAAAAGDRPGARRRRHRLPLLRDVRAVLVRPLDPRLRHEPGEPRRRVADDRAGARWRSWATAASGTTGCCPACSRRCSTATTRCC